MAQGNLKNLKKAPKSAGSQKRKTVRSKTVQSKGRKHYTPRRSQAVQSVNPQIGVTKFINKKNESIVAGKAVAAGKKFFLNDIADQGTKENTQRLKARDKKQDKSTKLTGRLKEQIQQLKKGTKTKK